MAKKKEVVKRSSNSKRKLVKGIFVVALIGLVALGIVYYNYFGKDVRMSGQAYTFKVVDENNNPLDGVKIYAQSHIYSTDSSGQVTVFLERFNEVWLIEIDGTKYGYTLLSYNVILQNFINDRWQNNIVLIKLTKKTEFATITGSVFYKDCKSLARKGVPNFHATVLYMGSGAFIGEFDAFSDNLGTYKIVVPKTNLFEWGDGTIENRYNSYSVSIDGDPVTQTWIVYPLKRNPGVAERLPWKNKKDGGLYWSFQGNSDRFEPYGVANAIIIDDVYCKGNHVSEPYCRMCLQQSGGDFTKSYYEVS